MKPIKLFCDNYQSKDYVPYLVSLFLFFVFRVLAQLIQKFHHVDFLPNFNVWYSGVLPYQWLLLSQLIIVIVMIYVIKSFASQKVVARYKLGQVIVLLGAVYFVVMFFRLMAGLTFASTHVWWGAKIPAFFHVILSLFVLLVGHFHFRNGER